MNWSGHLFALIFQKRKKTDMANSIKLESCPTCGAALAANLVKLLKTDPENYTCPGGSSDSRKKWESDWGNDFVEEENKAQLEWNQKDAAEEENDVAEPTVTGAI